jgi:hypothetical protein
MTGVGVISPARNDADGARRGDARGSRANPRAADSEGRASRAARWTTIAACVAAVAALAAAVLQR